MRERSTNANRLVQKRDRAGLDFDAHNESFHECL